MGTGASRAISQQRGSPGGSTARKTDFNSPDAARVLQSAIGNQALQRWVQTRPQSAAAPIQAAEDPAAIHAAAARGVATPGGRLPFADRIQASFGKHDVSQLQAHMGAAAGASALAMNASAYATGDHLVFAGAPDLFTAAHEAAHAVQQRAGVQLAGGVGAVGDRYERHADAVAARVSSGRSAEDLLDAVTVRRSANDAVGGAAIQERPARTGAVQRTWGSFFGSLGSYALGLPVRLLTRTPGMIKHVTWDLLKAVYKKIAGGRMPPVPAGGAAGPGGAMSEVSPLLHWLSGLTGAFDLVSLREFMNLLMSPVGRSLTPAERQLAQQYYGDNIEYWKVRVVENSRLIPPGAGAFTLAHTIHTPGQINLANAGDVSMLIHELVHIAQEEQTGVPAWIEMAWGRSQVGGNTYDYGTIVAGSLYADYTREQQGAIVQDYSEFLHLNPGAAGGVMINGTFGNGLVQDYQAMLQGLSANYRFWQRGFGQTLG